MPSLGARILSSVAEVWPDPLRRRKKRFNAELNTPEYHLAYARDQFLTRVSHGLGVGDGLPNMLGMDMLELGTGHGGIACYLACIGARSVVGVDVNERSLSYAVRFKEHVEAETGRELPLRFQHMDCHHLQFEDETFDIVVADNLFEHVSEPEKVLAEAHRVLRPGGRVLVPNMSAIRSKYGLHMKHGLKLPWANLFFSEKTIVEALRIRVDRHPELAEVYPGLSCGSERVRDVRRHQDLNDLTYAEFGKMATRVGFCVERLRVLGVTAGRILFKLRPELERTAFGDVLSTHAMAVLIKPEG
jgi:ubiquinone/menaquinone biosynthesis C-methylase UbiE